MQKGTRWRVGNATNIHPNGKVNMLINEANNRWQEDLIRVEFNEVEAKAILEMPLAVAICEDEIVWHQTSWKIKTMPKEASGYIIRDFDGSDLAFGQSKLGRTTDASTIKTLATVKAREFALQLRHQRVIFEGDALNVILSLQGRKYNEVAHQLARNCFDSENVFWMEDYPSFLHVVINDVFHA
ncbi:hypothetical protein GOBAR_DD16871 [Gossypium barbadense]|nr:hypothetical protein GOBAR_DD16871 [Gossypium barbadense]